MRKNLLTFFPYILDMMEVNAIINTINYSINYFLRKNYVAEVSQ